jgi:hypothetical protein
MTQARHDKGFLLPRQFLIDVAGLPDDDVPAVEQSAQPRLLDGQPGDLFALDRLLTLIEQPADAHEAFALIGQAKAMEAHDREQAR